MRITFADIGIVFGAIDLLSARHDETGPYAFDVRAEGSDWGNPEQIVRTIDTFLTAGTVQVVDGYGNREIVLELVISGEDSYGLAAGEKALFLEVSKVRNTLTWTPPNIITGSGTPSVFDVVTADLDHAFDDENELRLERFYKLTIAALPSARSDTLVTVPSPAPPNVAPTVTLIDNCNSTTGWTGSPNAATVSGGTAVRETWTNSAGVAAGTTLSLTRSGLSVDLTTAQYVRIDHSFSWASPGGGFGTSPETVLLNGIVVTEVARSANQAWYLRPPSVSTLTTVQITQPVYVNNGGNGVLTIFDISRSDVPQNASGARQVSRSFEVEGSAAAQGNLVLSDPSASLGSVLVFTTPAGDAAMQPPLREWRTAGSTETTDTTLVSGKYSDLSTLHTFDIPAANVPAGPYQLMVRVKHASAGSYAITYAGRSRMGSTNIDTGQTGTLTKTLVAGAWTILPLDVLTLPTYALGSAGLVRIELSGPAGLLLDEAWLFNIDTGQLTWVECGTGSPAAGGPASKLFLDAASLDNPSNAVLMGTASDRSDAYGAGYPALQAMGRHECTPESMNVFTVNTNSVATAVTLSYYPAFYTHVL